MNILEIDGKRYELVEIKEEPKQRKTGYERAEDAFIYFAQGTRGDMIDLHDVRNPTADDLAYNSANYYTDEQLAKDNARADALMRNLRRFSAEGREKKIVWSDRIISKWFILYNHSMHTLEYDSFSYVHPMCVFFDTKELAQAAIEKYHDELMWYFTEYQDTAEFREDV